MTLPSPIRVLLADDHDLVRSGIKALLGTMSGIHVAAEARNGHELLALLNHADVDVVLTDISMPGMDGITAIGAMRRLHPHVRAMVLSMHDSMDYVRRAVANGACGYLTKDVAPCELEQALHHVVARGSYFAPAVALQLLEPSGETVAEEQLTPRQIEILKMLADGCSSKQMAATLGLSSKTVDVHRGRIMERLGLHDVASLTLFAVRKGLVEA